MIVTCNADAKEHVPLPIHLLYLRVIGFNGFNPRQLLLVVYALNYYVKLLVLNFTIIHDLLFSLFLHLIVLIALVFLECKEQCFNI